MCSIAGQVQQPYITVPSGSQLDFTSKLHNLPQEAVRCLTIAVTVDDKKITQQVSIEGKQVPEQSDSMPLHQSMPYTIFSVNLVSLKTNLSILPSSTPATNATSELVARSLVIAGTSSPSISARLIPTSVRP